MYSEYYKDILGQHIFYNLSILKCFVQENPNHMSLVEKIPQPSPGTYERTTQRKFPKLSATAVLAFMEKDRTAIEKTSHTKHLSPSKKHVPEGSLASDSVS